MKWLCIALLSLPVYAYAQAGTIYKLDRNGVVTYSNMPVPGAQRITLPEISLVPSVMRAERKPGGSEQAPITNGAVPSQAGLLPPPPPILQGAPQEVATRKVEPKTEVINPKAIALEAQLKLARQKLEDQKNIRHGDERNHQKVLDRLKPFEEDIIRLEQELRKARS